MQQAANNLTHLFEACLFDIWILKGIVVLLTNDDPNPPVYRQFTFWQPVFIVLRTVDNTSVD